MGLEPVTFGFAVQHTNYSFSTMLELLCIYILILCNLLTHQMISRGAPNCQDASCSNFTHDRKYLEAQLTLLSTCMLPEKMKLSRFCADLPCVKLKH